MKDILEKLSSYNIFNYLFPGILFVILAKATTDYNLIQPDIVLGVFLYYFIGMIISRFGSVIIEPLLKRVSFLKFSDYKAFVYASKQDSKLELLSEVNNTYRTLNSMLFLLLFLKLYNYCSIKFHLTDSIALVVLTILITVLFLFSYRKQTNYISKRIDSNKPNNV
jgi:hypothetical protein